MEESLPDRMRSAGVTVAVENMFPVRVGGEMTFHADQDLRSSRVCPPVLDTSHAAVAEHDLVEVRRLDGRIRHVLSDNAGKGWTPTSLRARASCRSGRSWTTCRPVTTRARSRWRSICGAS
jgi:uncharacterized protein (DUF2342 family)